MSTLISNLNQIESCKLDIKSAIEAKGVDMTGVSFPGYAEAIASIQGGGGAVTEPLSVSVNGTYYPGQGVDGFSVVEVSVPSTSFVTEPLSVSQNGEYYPEQGVDGFSYVSVTVPLPKLTTLSVSKNGTYRPGQYNDGFSRVHVDVSPELSTLYVNQNGEYRPTSPFDGFSYVSVSVPQNASLGSITITDPATYFARDYGYDGFSVVYTDFSALTFSDVIAKNYFSAYIDDSTISYVASGMFDRIIYKVPTGLGIYPTTKMVTPALLTVSLPACEYVGDFGFGHNNQLTDIYLPNCSFFAQQAFVSCTQLLSVSFSSCTYIGSSCFSGCTALQVADLGVCKSIGARAFWGCSSLRRIALRGDYVCALPLSGGKPSLPMSGKVQVYVPSDLIEGYQQAWDPEYSTSLTFTDLEYWP